MTSADAAGAHDRHARAHVAAVQQHVDVAQHVGAVAAGDARVAWPHAGGEHHVVVAARGQHHHIGFGCLRLGRLRGRRRCILRQGCAGGGQNAQNGNGGGQQGLAEDLFLHEVVLRD